MKFCNNVSGVSHLFHVDRSRDKDRCMDLSKLMLALLNFANSFKMLLNSRNKVWSSVTKIRRFKVVLMDVICTVNSREQSRAMFSASSTF